jgi:hypothetical protein
MAKKSVQALLEDIRLVSEQNYEIVGAVRALVKNTIESASEEVKYGGILFTSGVQFGGVFAYKAHVTVEFGNGAKIIAPFGFLEGTGKGRRHVKLMSVSQIKDKNWLSIYRLLCKPPNRTTYETRLHNHLRSSCC